MSADLLVEAKKDFEKVVDRHIAVLIDGARDLEQDYSRFKNTGRSKQASQVADDILALQQRAFKTLRRDLNVFCRFIGRFYEVLAPHPELAAICRRWTETLIIDQCHNETEKPTGSVATALALGAN